MKIQFRGAITRSVLAVLMGGIAMPLAQAQQMPLPSKASEVPGAPSGTAMTKEYVQMVGRMAYVWGWPLVNSHNRRAAFSLAPMPGLNGGVLPMAPVGQNAMLTDYVKPEQTFVTCPNQDVVYGAGYFALDKEPVVFQVPDFKDRFWVYALYDARTDEFSEIGKPYGTKPGFYLLVGPQWKGDVPAGITAVLRSSTELVFAAPRVFKDDAVEDTQAVQAVLSEVMFYPLSQFDGKTKTTDWSKLPHFPVPEGAKGETKWVIPEKFADLLPGVMKQVPPLPGEEALYGWIGSVLEAASKDPEVRKALIESFVTADKELISPLFQWKFNGRSAGNGWNSPVNNARWGTDYLNRTATAKSNMYDNKPDETKYIYRDYDSQGRQLHGRNLSTITFAKGQTPPVKGFWSLTLYDENHLFFPNAMNRYSLGTKSKSLQYNPDGSLTLYFGAASPGKDKETNWVPAPDGPFSLYMRCYWADKAILDGDWTPPNVETVTQAPAETAKRSIPPIGTRFDELANLPFTENRPTNESAQTLRDELLFQRATQTYLWALPLINTLGMKVGSEKAFGAGYNVLPIWKKRLDAKTLVTTPNSDVIYAMSYVDLGKDGPLVFEAPPMLQGILLDFWQRPIPAGQFQGDIGLPGPDAGKGGKFLLLPPGYQGAVPEGYYVYRSGTNNVFIFLRGFYQDPKNLTPAVNLIQQSRIYPLNSNVTPKPMQFPDASGVPVNMLPISDSTAFDSLKQLVDQEGTNLADSDSMGMLASIGIIKGEPFAPDARTRAILDRAAKTAYKMSRVVGFEEMLHDGSLRVYPDRRWINPLDNITPPGPKKNLDLSWRNLSGGFLDLDARIWFFTNYYSVSPGMLSRIPGKGAAYMIGFTDGAGSPLSGGHHYRLTLPANIPAANFWSVTLYEAENASGLANGQAFPSLGSRDQPKQNDDGSTDLYFGPQAPEGKAGNWLATVPGKGYFAIIRLYGPTEAAIQKTWKPGDFEKIK